AGGGLGDAEGGDGGTERGWLEAAGERASRQAGGAVRRRFDAVGGLGRVARRIRRRPGEGRSAGGGALAGVAVSQADGKDRERAAERNRLLLLRIRRAVQGRILRGVRPRRRDRA